MCLDHLILLENSLVDDILIKTKEINTWSMHLKNEVSYHPNMAGNSLLGAHVIIYSFHLFGHQFSKIIFIFLKSIHI
jgi:hypothetical protein